MPEARSVDAQFAARLSKLLGLDEIAVNGRAPRGARRLTAEELTADGRKVLEASGYRTLETLAAFDLATLRGILSVRDLDRLAELRAQTWYGDVKGMTSAQKEKLAAHRVHPARVTSQLPHCGTVFEDKYSKHFEVRDDLLAKFEDLVVKPEVLRPRDELVVVPGVPWNGGPEVPREDPLLDLDPTHPFDPVRLESLLSTEDDEFLAHAGEVIRLAEGAAIVGRTELANETLRRLTSSTVDTDDPMLAHMRHVLAPAIGIAANPVGSWTTRTAAEALRVAPAGLSATARVRDAFLHGSLVEAQSLRRRAAAQPAEVRAVASREVANAYARLTLGLDAEGKCLNAGLSTQGIAAITDLHRSLYTAVLGTETRTYPTNAPEVLAGRATVSVMHHFGSGGVSVLGSPYVTGVTLTAFSQARALSRLITPLPAGDVFRFDWLLEEVRAVTSQVEGLDQLLVMLIEETTDALPGLEQLTEEILEEVAKHIEQLVQQINGLAKALDGIMREITAAALQSSLLHGVAKVIRDWRIEQWIEILGVVGDALFTGSDPVQALDAWITNELTSALGPQLADVIARMQDFREVVRNGLESAVLPPDLGTQLTTLLAESGVLGSGDEAAKMANELMAPLLDVLASTTGHLLGDLDRAIADLQAIAAGGAIPPALKVALVTWVVAPMLTVIYAFAGIAVASAPAAAAVAVLARLLETLGLDLLERFVVDILMRVLGAAGTLQRTADGGLEKARAMADELMQLLSSAGGLQTTLSALQSHLDGYLDAYLPDAMHALRGSLFTARSAIRGHLTHLLLALDRSFFRETLTAVAQPGELELKAPLPPVGSRTDVAPLYNELGLTAQLGGLLPRYEATRVTRQRLSNVKQEFTHVLSLADILRLPVPADAPAVPAAGLGALLQAGGRLPFTLTQELFDRVAPGIHEQLLRDVTLHIDFATPVATEQAFATLLDMLGSAAGGAIDPALVARTAGFGWPSLPIVPTRLPTGLPVVLTHTGKSRIRISPVTAGPLRPHLTHGPCDGPRKPSSLPPSLAGVRMLPDPDPAVDAAGWKVLEIADRPQSLMFSHFELLRDGVRFVGDTKDLKPFELRGAIGTWTLEVPALVRNFVDHELPPIRDIRLVISTEGRWSPELAAAVTQPSRQSTAPQSLGELPADLGDLVESIDDLAAAIGTLGLGDLGPIPELPAPTAPGNVLRLVPLLGSSLPDDVLTAGLAGTGELVFPQLDQASLAGYGVETAKVVGVRAATVSLLPIGRVASATVPDIAVTVTRRSRSGKVKTVSVTTSGGIHQLTQSELEALAKDVVKPEGVWTLHLDQAPTTGLASLNLVLVVEQTA